MTPTETYNDRVVRLFLLAASVWGVVGMSVGVLAAAQLAWPALNFDVPWLTFSRIRPDHTFGVVFAFGGSALMGTCYYVVQRTCHTRLALGRLASIEPASGLRSEAGLGIRAQVAGRELVLGRPDFAAAVTGTGADAIGAAADERVVLADETGLIAAFELVETLRPDAPGAVAALRGQGLSIGIVSGDAVGKVAAAAARLGIADWRARQLPADKLASLEALRAGGARVVAVGDGINDAPVLAGADVAVALAEGAELAPASSDVVLTGGRLASLAEARLTALQTLAVLRRNQRWAVAYNVAAVPLAALGFVPPWLAALGMSFSSLVVVLNALRIGRAGAARRAPRAQAVTPSASHAAALRSPAPVS